MTGVYKCIQALLWKILPCRFCQLRYTCRSQQILQDYNGLHGRTSTRSPKIFCSPAYLKTTVSIPAWGSKRCIGGILKTGRVSKCPSCSGMNWEAGLCPQGSIPRGPQRVRRACLRGSVPADTISGSCGQGQLPISRQKQQYINGVGCYGQLTCPSCLA